MASIVHHYHRFGGRGYRQRVYVERAQPMEQYTTEELLVNQFVSFPMDVQIGQTKHKFFLLGNMPNTIGVIDCTHGHIQAPHERDWEYINRKGRRSINIQLVGDADLIITNCVVKWPGFVHDARILRECFIQRAPNQLTGWHNIRRQCLSTPTMASLLFLQQQARFNTAHCKTRCAIERLNGVLKRRFACLNYLRVEPQGACNIILACIILHNIATRRNVPLCDDVYDAPEPVEEPDQPLEFCRNEGRIVRDAIVRHYF
ncbi:putative nuclease HARBI1 [Tachysurus ichikawai]